MFTNVRIFRICIVLKGKEDGLRNPSLTRFHGLDRNARILQTQELWLSLGHL